jgi:hypothetical protein
MNFVLLLLDDGVAAALANFSPPLPVVAVKVVP